MRVALRHGTLPLLASIILLLIVLPSLAVAETTTPPFTPTAVQQMVTLRVERAKLTLYIYPDGAVQAHYLADAALVLKKPTTVSVEASYRSIVEKTSSATSLHVSAEFPSSEAKPFSLKLMLSYSFSGGNGWLKINATASGGEEYWANIAVRLVGAKKARVVIEAAVPVEKAEKLTAVNPAEINKMFASRGAPYLHVEGITVEKTGDKATIRATGYLDIDQMLQYAVSNGMSAATAQKLKELLETSPPAKGVAMLEARLVKAGSVDKLVFNYEAKAEGNMTALQEKSLEAAKLENQLIAALLSPIAQQNPKLSVLVLQLRLASQQGQTLLETVPPSRSNATLTLKISGTKGELHMDYYSHRMRIPGKAGAGAAEATLAALSKSYQGLLLTLGQLNMIAPGVASLVPTTVKIMPLDGVEVSSTEATLTQLTGIKVKIMPPAVPAATASLVKTTSQTTSSATAATTTATTAERTGTSATTSETSTAAGSTMRSVTKTTKETTTVSRSTATSPAAATSVAQTRIVSSAQQTSKAPNVSPQLLAVALLAAAAIVAALVLRRSA